MTTAQRRLSHSATSITQFVQKAFAPNPVVQFRIRDRMVKCASVCIMAEFSISSSVVRSKMPELDTLRGIAVLLVLFFHGFNLVPIPHEISSKAGRLWVVITSTGWMGVNLFFVLSGFLITGILIESRETPNYFKRFYFRRALRILPAYYAILLFCYWSHISALWTAAWAVVHWSQFHLFGKCHTTVRRGGPIFDSMSLAVKNTSISFGLLPSDTSRAGSCSTPVLPSSSPAPFCAPCTMCAATITGRHTLGWWPIPWLAALSWQY
jgi:hypothetical protein